MTNDNDVLNEDDETEDQSGDLWYDYFRYSNEGVLRELVSSKVELVDAIVSAEGCRKRAQRAGDRIRFKASIDSIVSNLAYVFVQWKRRVPIAVSRKLSGRSECTNVNLPSKTFIRCLNLLENCGILSQSIGSRFGQRTTIIATESFQAELQTIGLDFSCFRECSSRPLVVLKRSIKTRPGKPRRREPVSLRSNLEIAEMDAQVASLNAFLNSADISFNDDCVIPVVDDHSRTLVRYFTIRDQQAIRFDQGGRLFGPAFWLNLKSDRRNNLRIDGEPVADLDFSNLGPRLAYTLIGQNAPDGDLYDLTGLLTGYDHKNAAHRKAIKRAFASCLNGGKGGCRGKKPRDGKPGTTGILDPLPKGITAAKIRAALWKRHPAIEQLCDDREPPIGFTIMFTESRILLCALEKLMALGVVALPVHDGLMCARSNREIAQEALGEASEEIVGVRLPVELKADYGLPGATEGLLAA